MAGKMFFGKLDFLIHKYLTKNILVCNIHWGRDKTGRVVLVRYARAAAARGNILKYSIITVPGIRPVCRRKNVRFIIYSMRSIMHHAG